MVPLAILHWVVTGSSSVAGLGDVAIAVKRQLWSSPELQLSAGISTELPTGSQSRGLGMGHFVLAPVVAVSTDRRVGYLAAVGGAEAAHHTMS